MSFEAQFRLMKRFVDRTKYVKRRRLILVCCFLFVLFYLFHSLTNYHDRHATKSNRTPGTALIRSLDNREKVNDLKGEVNILEDSLLPINDPEDRICNVDVTSRILEVMVAEVKLAQEWPRSFDADDKRFWNIPEHFGKTLDSFFTKFHPYSFKTNGKKRYFHEFVNAGSLCNIVVIGKLTNCPSTLKCSIPGVGGDFTGEAQLQSRHPHCRFLAIDPDPANRKLVESLPRSRFVETAAGSRDGMQNAQFRDGVGRPPIRRKTQHTDVVKLLIDNYAQNAIIDLMLINTKGAEYEIFPYIARNLKAISLICQINIDIHAPASLYGHFLVSFNQFLSQFLQNSDYVLLHAEKERNLIDGQLRLFLVNMAEQRCSNKFFCY
ncbi:hypothetical protein M3Y95_00854700 [Aphelenchoides besseyi]|nr:hypothetical protein M3Y95_00854700 [Aphelenchoides besseyi]